MSEKTLRLLAVAALFTMFSFVAGGCAPKSAPTVEPTIATVEPPADEPFVDEPRAEEPVDSTVLEGRTTAPMLPAYFDFDRSNIRVDQRERLENNASFLKDKSRINIRIEGNCDERGTNEYNMALGQRRANSAKKYLKNLGISGNRIDTLSYGEEKPLMYGHDEDSWQQNRRDDFIIE